MENLYAPIRQEVITDSTEIFNKICEELINAKDEILIASAWFTDPELLKIIEQRTDDGISISLIIADNQENRKLDFSKIERSGAKLLRIKNVGYGMMHQKFCVIDRKLVIHGSYNWSVNARKNNHESVILTTERGVVDSLIKVFNDIIAKTREKNGSPIQIPIPDKQKKSMLDKFISIFLPRIRKSGIDEDKPRVDTPTDLTLPQQHQNEMDDLQYRKVLDSMIAAEVNAFDRVSIRSQGFDRAKANNGDHLVLSKSLDSLYSVFVNDINVVEDKKRRLLSKINEQKINQQDFLKIRKEDRVYFIENETHETKNKYQQQIASLISENLTLETEIQSINNTRIGGHLEKIERIKSKISELKIEFSPLGKKKFQLYPLFGFGGLMIIYLLLFYSSATYILLFSRGDAELAIASGKMVVTPEVFNPWALGLAMEKGVSSIALTIFFPIALITLAIVSRLTGPVEIVGWRKVVWDILITYGIIIGIDIIIAIRISQSIHDVKYLTGVTSGEWEFSLLDLNMWLVFVMGAVGLFVFKAIYSRIIELYEERSPDLNTQKKFLEIKELQREIVEKEDEVHQLKLEMDEKNKQIIQNKAEIILCESEIENLPFISNNKIEQAKNECSSKLQNIQQITDIYTSHIENDNLPVSVDSLKDRMNIFIEGWNDYLHHEFSITKASEKGWLASEIASSWLESKLATSKLDQRIKL